MRPGPFACADAVAEDRARVTLGSSGLGSFDVTWASRAEDPDGFREWASRRPMANCPVSKALAAVPIALTVD